MDRKEEEFKYLLASQHKELDNITLNYAKLNKDQVFELMKKMLKKSNDFAAVIIDEQYFTASRPIVGTKNFDD